MSADLFGGLAAAELLQAAIDPLRRELLLEAVLPQPLMEAGEVDTVEPLVLIEAGEDDGLGARRRIFLHLKALRADFLHHALHRRVDRGDRVMAGLEMRLERAFARPRDRA